MKVASRTLRLLKLPDYLPYYALIYIYILYECAGFKKISPNKGYNKNTSVPARRRQMTTVSKVSLTADSSDHGGISSVLVTRE